MKKIILISSVVIFLAACGGSGNGELIGVQKRKTWNPTDPYGMVFIPQGTFTMGPSDQDVPFANVSESKSVSVGAFYMDETEITNNEYRQFTRWVRDSLLRTEQNLRYKDWGSEKSEKGKFLSADDKKQPNLDWNEEKPPIQLVKKLEAQKENMVESDNDFNSKKTTARHPLNWD